MGRNDKRKLSDSIGAYQRSETPLVVLIALLRHYFRLHHNPHMEKPVYLRPHPQKLGCAMPCSDDHIDTAHDEWRSSA
ncbi:DUF1722 domain-containing protein [Sedimenticola hydrogenitrophicus]|uniref:DUF1722 domain-containing protein n=1 Tax=Sedimenticola hydrogenitrophicus TaxID=2967975 RepID=UPI003B58790A